MILAHTTEKQLHSLWVSRAYLELVSYLALVVNAVAVNIHVSNPDEGRTLRHSNQQHDLEESTMYPTRLTLLKLDQSSWIVTLAAPLSLLIGYVASSAAFLAFAAALCSAATGRVEAAAKKLDGGPAVGLLYLEPSTVCATAGPKSSREAIKTEYVGCMIIWLPVCCWNWNWCWH